MEIVQIKNNKSDFLDLLLIADEEKTMIDKYLDKGDVFALYDTDLRSICVVTDENNGLFEIKNIATYPQYQRKGYAKILINYILFFYKDKAKTIQVGTGDSPLTIPFYESCGFSKSHIIPNFFVDNYSHPIIEGGVRLVDMIYLTKEL